MRAAGWFGETVNSRPSTKEGRQTPVNEIPVIRLPERRAASGKGVDTSYDSLAKDTGTPAFSSNRLNERDSFAGS
jgi:hypothetical protein